MAIDEMETFFQDRENIKHIIGSKYFVYYGG